MNTYEKYFTYQGCEYYICTEYEFDHADQLRLAGFAMWRDEEEVSEDDFKANQGLYDIVCEILANEDAVCYGGAPC